MIQSSYNKTPTMTNWINPPGTTPQPGGVLQSLNQPTPQPPASTGWQPSQGLTWDQLRNEITSTGQYGSRGHNNQLYGRLQEGDKGYDPQKSADYDAMRQYGADQGWIQPHKASWSNAPSSIWKSVGPVVLGALGGAALSGLGTAGAAAGGGAGTAGGAGAASGLGGASGAVGTAFGAPAITGGGLGGVAGGVGGAAGAAGLGTGVGMGAGLAGTAAGIGATSGPAAMGATGAATGASGGLNSFLSSTFGPGATAGGVASTIGILGQIGSDLYSSGKFKDIASQAADRADPFASQRPQYQGMLQEHMTDPSSFMNSPQVEQAVEAAARRMAAMGYNLTPNQADEIRKSAMDQYYRQTDVLSNLSGAGFGPGNAGSVFQQGQNQGEAQRYQGIANIGTLLGDLYKRNSSGNSNYSLV